MKTIDKIKGLDETKRRVVVFAILLFLALPLTFLVFRNFKIRMEALNQTAALKALQLPEITPEISQSIDELQQAKENFDEQRALLEIWGDFSTSTMSTSTGEINFENNTTTIPEGF